jgi:hypothetical protein
MGTDRPTDLLNFLLWQIDTQTIVGQVYVQRRSTFGVNVQILEGFTQKMLQLVIIYRVFIMIETQLFHLCPDSQLHSNDIARMAPCFLGIEMVCKPVLGIEDENIRFFCKSDEGVILLLGFLLVFRIGGIDHFPAILFECISIGIIGMDLLYPFDFKSRDGIGPIQIKDMESNICLQGTKGYGEDRWILLFYEDRFKLIMIPVNINRMAEYKGGGKKGKAVDVIPVQM